MARPRTFVEEEVLQRAVKLFWEKGFHATSMQDLVERLQINRASLYATFGDKRQLFERTMQYYQTVSHQRLQQHLWAYEQPQLAFRELLYQTAAQTCQDPKRKGCFFVNVTTELAARDESLLTFLSKNRLQTEQIFLDYLRERQAQGYLATATDLPALASLLFTFYNGLQVTTKLRPELAKIQAMIDVFVRQLA
ncbi:MAG: helix-turn-helix domain-containing protein [Bacteroidota bacterium]